MGGQVDLPILLVGQLVLSAEEFAISASDSTERRSQQQGGDQVNVKNMAMTSH